MSSRSAMGERGYAMAALLVGMAVMAIMLSVAMPVWRTAVQREREAELVFRGEQYANAIAIFQRRTGGFPQTLDQLEKTRAIRKLYKDPITGGDFQPVYVGQIVAGQPVVPGQRGRGAGAQTGGATGGTAGATGGTSGAISGTRGTGSGGAGQPLAGQRGRGGANTTPGIGATAGPIIGVISTSTAESLRLYNGRGHYNEWAFVATAATQQAGAPNGAQTPGLPPGRNTQPGPRGIQSGPRGSPPNPFPRGALPFPGRGLQPGRGQFPGNPPGTNPSGGASTPQR